MKMRTAAVEMLRRRVLACFKELHRTRRQVFADDEAALAAGRIKINEEFRKNQQVNDSSEIEQLVTVGLDTARYLRTMVVQGVLNENTGAYRVNVTQDSVLEDNVPYRQMDDEAQQQVMKRKKGPPKEM